MKELNFPNAVWEEDDFYGRQAELRQIEGVFRSGRRVPVVILGERRIGKTSLQNIILQRLLRQEGGRFITLQIEPRGLVSLEDLTQAILQRLASVMAHISPASDSSVLSPAAVGQFDQVFMQLAEPAAGRMFLLCIDEFDEIVRSARSGELQRVMGLVHHLMEQAELPLRLFFTMTRIPEVLEHEFPSPLVSKSQPIELAPWEAGEMEAMVYGVTPGGSEWSRTGLDLLYRVSGGHPYFAKLLLALILESSSEAILPAQIGSNELEGALQAALRDSRANHVMENLYRVHFSDAEKEVTLALARRGSAIFLKELKLAGQAWATAARRLEQRHYLSETPHGFDFRIAFWGHWLRNWIEYDEECERLSTLINLLAEPVEIEVDVRRKKVHVMGDPVSLSVQEMRILECLAQKTGQLVAREGLVEAVWETRLGVSDETVDTAFYRLRKKIGDKGQYIETVQGQGFILHRAALVSKE